ncbi:hypothetical protein, partial [Nocardia noduli]|uniref:hypothetical protein n=1 Tax=Nocardia noduli TaxID=2815722 RepID=UPI001C24E579
MTDSDLGREGRASVDDGVGQPVSVAGGGGGRFGLVLVVAWVSTYLVVACAVVGVAGFASVAVEFAVGPG